MKLGKRVGLGIGAVLLIGVLLSMGMGVLVCSEIVAEDRAFWLLWALMQGVLFGSCYWCARSAAKSRLPIALTVAGGYTLLLWIGRILIWTGEGNAAWWRLLAPILVGALAGLCSGRKRTRRR